MSPILEAARALALWIALGLFLLREVPLAVCDDATHVVDIIVIVGLRVLLRVLLEDPYDLSSTFVRKMVIEKSVIQYDVLRLLSWWKIWIYRCGW